ncbi:MAG: hypothetical protein AB1Z23_01600 [Eubacteriales bacterium]
MIKFKSKLLMSFLLMLIGSIAIMGTAFAGVSISGNSQVYPGRTYTYTVTVTATGSSIMGKATSGGVLGSQTKTWSKDSSTGLNQSLTATTKITVTIPSSAAIGSTGTISVSGQGSTFDGTTVGKFSISGSKTITVVTPPTPPPPTAWELAIREIKKVEEGGSITVEMRPENAKEINVPIEAFTAIKEKGIVLTVDYGTFKCIIDGKTVGSAEKGMEDINLGYEVLPAERADDLIVFSPNNAQQFVYSITYAMPPSAPAPEDTIYVYRRYLSNPVVEFVNNAEVDDSGNLLIYIFAPGQYIVSAKSIDGTEGNVDMEALKELFATPTPSPTPEPTPTLTPSPTPEIVEDNSISMDPAIALIILLGALAAAFITAMIIFKAKGAKPPKADE